MALMERQRSSVPQELCGQAKIDGDQGLHPCRRESLTQKAPAPILGERGNQR